MRDIDYGYEFDRLGAGFDGLVVRWWLVVRLDGEDGRRQRPRLGVVDRGFRFARGGRVRTAQEAEDALHDARGQAEREADYWRGQPSHALGSAGELVPLGEVVAELTG